ncbi:MAG: phosphohydrolase [Planctomycetaceae bacterium]|nr:MAG: phosphohydrolase [Planctomycetaceae bacterium]
MAEHGTTRSRPDRTIMTYTGKIVHPLAITAADIDIHDIAHALAMKCRYTGHCQRFYSVAQHCVLMARWDKMPGPAPWRLMHDASEAYLPDIASPIKGRFPIMREAEARIQAAVAERFGLPPFESVYPDVHIADTWLMIWEGRNNMDDENRSAVWWRLDAPAHVLDHNFWSWEPAKAEKLFMKEAACQLGL